MGIIERHKLLYRNCPPKTSSNPKHLQIKNASKPKTPPPPKHLQTQITFKPKTSPNPKRLQTQIASKPKTPPNPKRLQIKSARILTTLALNMQSTILVLVVCLDPVFLMHQTSLIHCFGFQSHCNKYDIHPSFFFPDAYNLAPGKLCIH